MVNAGYTGELLADKEHCVPTDMQNRGQASHLWQEYKMVWEKGA